MVKRMGERRIAKTTKTKENRRLNNQLKKLAEPKKYVRK
jgi:hypothetical protein